MNEDIRGIKNDVTSPSTLKNTTCLDGRETIKSWAGIELFVTICLLTN